MPVRKMMLGTLLICLGLTVHAYALDCSTQNSGHWIICSMHFEFEDGTISVAKVSNKYHDHSMGAHATKTGGLIFFATENNIFSGTIKLEVDGEKPITFDYHSPMANVGEEICDNYFTNGKRSMAFIAFEFKLKSKGLQLYNQLIKGKEIKLKYKPFFKDAMVVFFTLEGARDAINTLRNNLE
ncbi:MAG: hypothetical protein JRJ23_05595 [Deltaproteobacteria bacterium]|nr:hypothetical protein [Deltaproteobacteria bacterium]